MPNLHVIVASTRPGRIGPSIGDWVLRHAEEHGHFDTTLVDLAQVGLPFFDEPAHPSERDYRHDHTRRWSALVEEADAFAFVMPEYNYGFNAELKNALDFLYHEWSYKPVGLVSYGGTSAGTRAAQMVKQVVTTLRMMPLNESVAIHHPADHLVDGDFRPPARLDEAARLMLDTLASYTEAFRTLRARQPA